MKVRICCGVCGKFIKELEEDEFLEEFGFPAPADVYLDFCSEECKAFSDEAEVEMEKQAEDEWKFEQEQIPSPERKKVS